MQRELQGSDSDDAFGGLYFLDQVFADIAFHIDDVVRQIAPALVDHVGNIELAVGQKFGDLFDHARCVLVGDGESLLARSVEAAFGEVNRVFDVAVFQEIHELQGGHDGAVFLGFIGGGAQVRNGKDFIRFDDFLIREVRHVAAYDAVGNGFLQRRGVHEARLWRS